MMPHGAMPGGFLAYLSELLLDTSVRHQGIVTRLVQAVESVLGARQQPVVIADVWPDAVEFVVRSVRNQPILYFSCRIKPSGLSYSFRSFCARSSVWADLTSFRPPE
jgi:hypothetical protein